jgi:hypothetical protein
MSQVLFRARSGAGWASVSQSISRHVVRYCLHCPRAFTVLALLALVVCISIPATAQSDTASITGTIRDQSGSSVPNATVSVKNEATGLERRATTNQDGRYTASNLPPGLYTISVESQGFRRYESRNNQLTANVSATVDVP